MKKVVSIMYKQILGISILGLWAMAVQGAGFNCLKAITFVEKAICQHLILSTLDDKMVLAFNDAKTVSKDTKALIKQQVDWLKNKRNVCQTNTCLEKVYKERIIVLQNTYKPAFTISSKYIRCYANGKPDYNSASLTIYQSKEKVKIMGNSIWVGDPETGNVNMGEVEGIFDLKGDTVHYTDDYCDFLILIGENALTITNDNGKCGGMNVTFDGFYKKIK